MSKNNIDIQHVHNELNLDLVTANILPTNDYSKSNEFNHL